MRVVSPLRVASWKAYGVALALVGFASVAWAVEAVPAGEGEAMRSAAPAVPAAFGKQKKIKRYFEISTEPWGILQGTLMGQFAWGFHPHMTLGLEAGYTRFSEQHFKITGYTYRGAWAGYKNSLYESGPMVEWAIGYTYETLHLDFAAEDTAVDGVLQGSWSALFSGMLIGYRFVWDGGVYLTLAAGPYAQWPKGRVPSYMSLEDEREISAHHRLHPKAYTSHFRVGYNF